VKVALIVDDSRAKLGIRNAFVRMGAFPEVDLKDIEKIYF